jgi:DNA-binding response OmpR family regulator
MILDDFTDKLPVVRSHLEIEESGAGVFKSMRILIVEDEPLIAIDLESAVRDQQGDVVGPVHSLADAIPIAEAEDLHGAILDVRLMDGTADPIIACLLRRGIPLVIYTGEADDLMAANWPGIPIVGKPASPEDVIATLERVIRTSRPQTPRSDDNGGSLGGTMSGG